MSAHDDSMQAGAKRPRDDGEEAGGSSDSAQQPKKTRLQVLWSQAATRSAEYLAAGMSSGREWANAALHSLASSTPEDVQACKRLAATALRNVATSALSSLRSAFPVSQPLPAIEQNVLATEPDTAEQRDNDPKDKRASEPVPAIEQNVLSAQPVVAEQRDTDTGGQAPASEPVPGIQHDVAAAQPVTAEQRDPDTKGKGPASEERDPKSKGPETPKGSDDEGSYDSGGKQYITCCGGSSGEEEGSASESASESASDSD